MLEVSETLKGYSLFVAKVRKYRQEAQNIYDSTLKDQPLTVIVDKEERSKMFISQAVTKAVDECISENILADFFRSNRQEVIEVSILEYTAEGHIQELQDESYNNGVANTNSLYAWLNKTGRQDDIFKAIADKAYYEKLSTEYQNAQKGNS